MQDLPTTTRAELCRLTKKGVQPHTKAEPTSSKLAQMAQQKRTMPAPLAASNKPSLRAGPVLTLYPSGLANLNGNASRLLPKGTDCFLLLPPTLTRPRWAMLVGPRALAGDIKLTGRSDRPGALRFRAPELALSLFAALPAEQTALRLRLAPEAERLDLFQLLPVH